MINRFLPETFGGFDDRNNNFLGSLEFHGFNNEGYSGARQAVKEFCDKNNIGYVCLSDDGGSAVIVK